MKKMQRCFEDRGGSEKKSIETEVKVARLYS